MSTAQIVMIDETTKNTVIGYIRKLQKSFPIEVTTIILLYFYRRIIFKPFLKYDMMLKNNDLIATKISSNNTIHPITFTMNQSITNEECDTFILYIRWKKCVSSFFMGYSTTNKIAHYTSLGQGKNSRVTSAFFVSNKSKYLYYWNNGTVTKLLYSSTFIENDIFKLVFNFIDNILVIYHNEYQAKCVSLNNNKEIIPAFTLKTNGDTIEIVKYQFCGYTKFKNIAIEQMDGSTKQLIYGYILNIIKFNKIYIPNDIIKLVLLYFTMIKIFGFNQTIGSGHGVKFLNSFTVKKMIYYRKGTCLMNDRINIKDYDKFRLHIRWNKCVSGFFMGFITSDPEMSYQYFDKSVGQGFVDDPDCSAFFVHRCNTQFIYWNQGTKIISKYQSSSFFGEQDIFILEFDFINAVFAVYHNGFIGQTVSLPVQFIRKLTPAFTLKGDGEEIEILRSEFTSKSNH